MNEYTVDWESSHSRIIKARSSKEAMNIARDEADLVVGFVAITDGPFVKIVHSGDK